MMFGVSRSSSALRLIVAPAESSIVLDHAMKPPRFTATSTGPAGVSKLEGVLPTNLPLTSMSAPSGREVTDIRPTSEGRAGAVDAGVGVVGTDDGACLVSGGLIAETGAVVGAAEAAGTSPCRAPNFSFVNLISPFTYAVISVPLGIVTSLPCMKKKKGAAEKNTIDRATMP